MGYLITDDHPAVPDGTSEGGVLAIRNHDLRR